MREFFCTIASARPTYRKLLFAGLAILACSIPLLADTPALLHGVTSGGCYCHCAEAHAKGGCVKMCDSKKAPVRWWTKSCAKPHMQTRDANSNAGPRFPHPGRAEHVQLQK